ncbi:helix-turn-helix transcriptional regulator [Burkholderia multivorans]|uniref:helix-turn-helix transcriptional regulator n=1 Tax=Burkholderia multivorans TaxID=87883 RepID=UPI0020191772|nr:helix-turn-helix transcriptional regulator [Burkholderia multivorans]MCL4649826.1 helix-turn-helix transcriptional regulator [Burkholderia multivorans]MCL4658688.1 helix-turn-helix transcriptional regulator [Burkholderia multivorans]MCO1424610.1 helix-turn-helix transcriptional regulator [Burkholderia multivorans]UQN54831.1 helix-turn-helix transcriptional regulator [Burkholderia multivorans]UQN80243.1 helix-turn-helix transcriptional regulator [Burkholderia multivorans]
MNEQVNEQALKSHTDRRQLHQIIAGLTEGVILIEPDQRIVWANEAALAMHGVTELEALGDNVTEYRERFRLRYRNNHPVRDGHYPMDRVIAGEEFSDVTVEVESAADDNVTWVHRIRSLVLTNAAGEPDCLALVLHDATEWASAEERFERTFNANPAPAVICRLEDLRYVKVNQGFLDMTGHTRDDVLGRSVYEVDVLEQAERRELAIERLTEGATIPQMEAVLKRADGTPNAVVVAGQPIDMNGEACMLFTFMDLEPRKLAERALRQSEERFATAFRMAPVATAIVTADRFELLDVNDAFVAMTGHPQEELLGKAADEIGLWAERGARQRIDAQLAKDGIVRNADVQIRTRDGDVRDCVVSADSVAIHGQDCLLIALLDISDRKRTEMELVYAIETAMQDASWFSRTLIEKLANVRRANAPDAGAQLSDLTARERDVFDLLCHGLADKEIAGRLGLAPNTVRNHVATIYAKLDVHSRGEAIVWARERGIVGSVDMNGARGDKGTKRDDD